MKIPAIHKYYTVNFFIYITLIGAISHAFVFHTNLMNLLITLILWFLSLPFLIMISFEKFAPFLICLIIGMEMLLHERGYIQKQNQVKISPKTQKIIYFFVLISIIYILWILFYFYPMLDKYAQYD